MAWSETDPRRLQKEMELMRGRTRAELRQVGDRLVWVEELASSATNRCYHLVIDYPDRFPHERPRAFIASPPIEGAPHRLPDGALCLFDNPFAADPKTTALLVRNRAVVWFLAYEIWLATGEWMAPEH